MNLNVKWRSWLTMAAAAVLIIVIGLTMGGRSRITFLENIIGAVITPVQLTLHSAGNTVGERLSPLVEVWSYEAKNAQLTAENEKLRKDLIKATLTSQELNTLTDLRASLNYAKAQGINNYITCDIIAKDPGNWYNLFVINAGSKQGILKNSTVLCGEGLVGLVYEVGDDWSKVISIIDNKSAVGFEIMDIQNNFDGRVAGNIDGSLKGYLYDPQAVVHTGQKIITSGLGIYPRGILIGEITEVIINKDNLLKEIVVKPEVNFLKLERVFVIPKTNSFVE